MEQRILENRGLNANESVLSERREYSRSASRSEKEITPKQAKREGGVLEGESCGFELSRLPGVWKVSDQSLN